MVGGEEGSDGWRFGLDDGGRRGFVWRQVGYLEVLVQYSIVVESSI